MPKIKNSLEREREERIVKEFKKALIEKKWTQQHLADLCGMDSGNISRVINHPMRVKTEIVLNIARKLGITSIPT